MGKTLIFKGADFSANSIAKVEYHDLLMENGLINIVPSELQYGSNGIASNETRIRSVSNIFLKSGESVTIYGLKGLNSQSSALKLDYCAYRLDERIKANVITTGSKGVPANYFPFNTQGLDSVTIRNDIGVDAYFGFTCALANKDTPIDAKNYSPLKYVK